jgi:hypothetical protein
MAHSGKGRMKPSNQIDQITQMPALMGVKAQKILGVFAT